MNRYLDSIWFRNAVLLAALAAGGLMTLVVPSYEQVAALRSQAEHKEAAAEKRYDGSGNVTGIDIDAHRTNFARGLN